MMRKLLAALAVATVLAVAAPRVALAHHAMQAEFDQNNVVVISGVLKKVNWVNPHVNFLLEVTEPDGKVTTWTLVHAGPNQLRDDKVIYLTCGSVGSDPLNKDGKGGLGNGHPTSFQN